jgi:chemotaxis protein CheZ
MSELLDIDAYADAVAALSGALASRDQQAFRTALSAFDSVRDGAVLTGVRRVTVELQSALQRFEVDSRLIGMAQQQVPDARRRLAHVMQLTSEAAHQTLDLAEQCTPLAENIAGDAAKMLESPASRAAVDPDVVSFLRRVVEGMGLLRSRLTEMRLAQAYQDLTGQILGSVLGLVDELERSLGELARITDAAGGLAAKEQTISRGLGPAVPGVGKADALAGQQDVDALLQALGI